MISRRGLLRVGGLTLAGPLFLRSAAHAGGLIYVEMRGRPDGSAVWFDPVGVWVRLGESVRWTNRDAGNVHTSTAYHPANESRPLRIPRGAQPWNSDYLLPGELFLVTPEVPGVYDYFCIPHEHAGMVGRLVVAEKGAAIPAEPDASTLPEAARGILPPVAEILRTERVRGGES